MTQDQLALQNKLQYDADKKSALEQGYTEEQAEQYAQQEAFMAQQKQTQAAPQPAAAQEASAADNAALTEAKPAEATPVVGPTVQPPGYEGRQ